MGDFYSAHWRARIAASVRGIIIEANRGLWPSNSSQWRKVAKRLGMTVKWVTSAQARQTTFGAELLEDLIICLRVDEARLCRWLAHEVTEGILRRDCGTEPYAYPESWADEYHEIARFVENGFGTGL